jgi:DNA-binding MarR family transcriptional regulator
MISYITISYLMISHIIIGGKSVPADGKWQWQADAREEQAMVTKKPMEPLLSWKIKDVHYQIGHYLQTLLVSEGLHFGHPRILFTIHYLQDASQKELAKRLQISPASLAVSLQRLEKAGFVERSCDETDQRVNKIRLSERGNQAVEICRKQLTRVNEALMADFTSEEKDQLFAYLDRLLAKLEEVPQLAVSAGKPAKTGERPARGKAPR